MSGTQKLWEVIFKKIFFVVYIFILILETWLDVLLFKCSIIYSLEYENSGWFIQMWLLCSNDEWNNNGGVRSQSDASIY